MSSFDVLSFLQHYQEYPCLWDKSIPEYKDRRKRDEAEEALLKVLKLDNVKMLRSKMRSIRKTYYREMQKINCSRRAGSNRIYKPRLYWFDYAYSFLSKNEEIKSDIFLVSKVPKKPHTNYPNNDHDISRRFILPRLPPRTSSPIRIPCHFNKYSKPTPRNFNFESNPENYEEFKFGLHQQSIKGTVQGLKFPNSDLLSGHINTYSPNIKTRDQYLGKCNDYVMVFPRQFEIGDFEIAEFIRRAYETVYDISTGHNRAFIE